MTKRLAAGAVAAVLACAGAAGAQTPGTAPAPLNNVNEKGVRVLQAEEPAASSAVAPAPTPTPPVVAPTPAPTPTPVVRPIIQLCERPFATTDVRWDGVSRIDSELARRLKTRQRVVVDLAKPYPEAAQAPADLSRWFSEVKRGGGAVTVKQYCKAARGGLGSWLAQIAEGLGGGRTYRPAREYDVLLHSDALDRVVTQVEFVPRGVAS